MARSGNKRKQDSGNENQGSSIKHKRLSERLETIDNNTVENMKYCENPEETELSSTSHGPVSSPLSHNKDVLETEEVDEGIQEEVDDAASTLTPVTTINGITKLLDSLSPRVRIISKTSITVKVGGVGEYFNFQFTDGETKMRGVVFGDPCKELHELLQADRVYQLTKFKLSAVNPKYGEGYEIILGQNSVIMELENVEIEMAEQTYEFMQVETIYNSPPGLFIDFLGTIVSFGPVQMHGKASSVSKLRNIEFMDERKFQILLVVWNELAETIDQLYKKGDVLILNQVKINEYMRIKKLIYTGRSSIVATATSSNPRFQRLKLQNSL